MNTAPMTTTPDTWLKMSEPMTFPALVQYDDGVCAIFSSNYGFTMHGTHTAIRWRPWVNPELPKPDAFKQYCIDNGFSPSGLAEPRYRACWQAATAAERSRFAEWVEKILTEWDNSNIPWFKVESDLRALAKGEK